MDLCHHSGAFQVSLLGPYQVRCNGTDLEARRWPRRSQQLLKLLLLARDHRLRCEEVIARFWPDASEARGASNVRWIVHELRRGLGDLEPSPLLTGRHEVVLNPAYGWEIDIDRFEALLGQEDDVTLIEQGLGLIQGEPLMEDRFEDWAIAIKQRVARHWRNGCIRAARLHREQRSHQVSLQWLGQILENDPLDEEALQLLLLVAGESGRRIEGMRTYMQFAQCLQRELNMAPDPRTSELADRLKGPQWETSVHGVV